MKGQVKFSKLPVAPNNISSKLMKFLLDQFLQSSKLSKQTGNIWNIIDNSITQGYGFTPYHTFIGQEKVISKNICSISETPLAIYLNARGQPSFIELYFDLPNADLNMVAIGVNDFLTDTPLGTFENRDNTTFYGALHNLIVE